MDNPSVPQKSSLPQSFLKLLMRSDKLLLAYREFREAGGLLVRVERRKEKNRSDTNLYDLTPLKAILEPHAEHEVAERAASHAGRRTRMTKVAKVPASDTSK